MNTRVLAAVGAAALIAAAAVVWLRDGRPDPTRAEGPVVFISIDTLRADRLPAYGGTGARTPHIDRLAQDGVVFENAYAHSPQTLPSHASILSGELPFTHGVRDNVGFTVRTGQRFLQHTLKQAGYATGGFVSSYVLRAQTGIGRGFDHFDDQLPAASPEAPLGQVQRAGEETIAAALRWVDAQASARFFLFAHIYEPHTPYAPPPRFTNVDPYDGEVEYSDEIVGRLLDHLRAKGLYDDATIVLLSDHGEGLGDHGEEEHGIFLYRETIRVPLIVKFPASRGAGIRVSTPVQHIDLVPTINLLTTGTHLALEPADGPRSRSLLPLLDGDEIPTAAIYSESLSPRYHFGWSELYSLSEERYRFIRAPKDELYDLAQDAREVQSIAGARPQVVTAMRSALDAVAADRRVTAPSSVSDADRQKLAALGYVGTQTGTAIEREADRLADPKDKVSVLRLYRAAVRLAGAGQHAEAAAQFRALLVEDPAMTDGWLHLAQAYERLHRQTEALNAYREVIRRDPRNPAALTGATAALLRTGRIDDAKAHAELAVDVAPAIAHEMLARIAVHQGDEAAARRHARLAETADPTLPMSAFIDGMLLNRRGEHAAAADRLLEATRVLDRRTEQLADVNFLAGDSLAHLDRHAEAERLFLAELAVFPHHVRARAGLAMLYKATGREADAARSIDDLLRHAPTPEGIDTAARLWTMFGEPARAAKVRAGGTGSAPR